MAWILDDGKTVDLTVELVCGKCRKQYTPGKMTLALPEYTFTEEWASEGSGISVEQLRELKARFNRFPDP